MIFQLHRGCCVIVLTTSLLACGSSGEGAGNSSAGAANSGAGGSDGSGGATPSTALGPCPSAAEVRFGTVGWPDRSCVPDG